MIQLRAQGMTVALGGRPVLSGVDLTLGAGQLVGLVGPNGAGKTTFLRAMAGLMPLRGGQVLLDERPLAETSRKERARRIAYLPQRQQVEWPLSVRRLVELGRIPHLEPWAKPGGADRAAVEQALRATETTGLLERPVPTLSDGERARVLLARCLAGDPEILLADEPVAGLDPYHALKVMELLGLRAASGMAVLVVLHDLALAARFCERLVLLADGRVRAEGAPLEVLSPAHLAESYGIRAQYGQADGRHYLVPWSRLDAEARR
ncbi:MAG TPA: ABC transporter ATP-binding protein [Alphaproteobacteria bacterium]|nr:ABC transporter ATP-binding protein [Alphaproteobacteria bacterium]